MLVIRYLRIGKKNQPSFKIVVTDKRKAPRGGRFVEILGFFNPLTKKHSVKKDRVEYWLSKGAQPSVSVHNLLVTEKIINEEKVATHAKSKKEVKPTEASVAPAPTPEQKPEEVKPTV